MNLKIEGRVDGKEIGLAKPTIKDRREGQDRSSISGIKLQLRPMRTPSPDLEVGSGQAMRTGPKKVTQDDEENDSRFHFIYELY